MKKMLLGAMLLVAAIIAVVAPSAPAFAQTNLKIGWVMHSTIDWNADPDAPNNLKVGIANRTGYNVALDFVYLDGPQDLGQYQMLVLTGHVAFAFTNTERAALKAYLEGGGFLFADDCNNAVDGGFDWSFAYEMSLMFSPDLSLLPYDHQVFNSFYVFTVDPSLGHNTPPTMWNTEPLQGISVNGSVRVVFDDNDYSCGWGLETTDPMTLENSLRVVTNAAVYALQDSSGSAPPPDPTRVDLALEWGDITFWTPDGLIEVTNPDFGEPVLIKAVVHNLSSDGTSSPGTVSFYDAYENVAETPINNGSCTAALSAIAPGGTGTAKILWTPNSAQTGYHLIRAWVYPDARESYTYNNSATHFIVLGGPPAAGDMNIDVLNLSLYPGGVYPVGTQMLLSGYVQYRWRSGYLMPLLGGDVTISLGGQTWTTRTLNNGMFYQWITLPTTAGSQTVTVGATDSTIAGTASVSFTTQSYPPDLVIRSIYFEQSVATVADTIHALVVNQGSEPLPKTTFSSSVEVRDPADQIVWTSSVSTRLTQNLQPNGQVDVAFPGFTSQVPGTYQIKVTVDPDGLVTTEPDKSNNTLTAPAYVYPHAVDLRVSSLNQSCTAIMAYVSNQGGLPSTAGTVTFSDQYEWSADEPLPVLTAKGGGTWVPVSYLGTGGDGTVITALVASPPDVDYNSADNTLSDTFNFSPQVDFILSETGVNERSFYDTNLAYISFPNTLRALVHNAGCGSASGQVQFSVNGLSTGTTAWFTLDGGTGIEVSVPYEFAGYTAGSYSLTASVTVDPSDALPASNTRTEPLVVAPQPCDLSVASSDIGFATYPVPPMRNEKFQISATIHNGGPAPAKEFQVAFYEEGRIPIGNILTFHLDPGIAPGGTLTVDATELWGYGFSGNHAIIVQVAPLAGIQDDTDDTNNTASRTVWINNPPTAQATLVSQYTTDRENDTVSLSAAGSNDELDTAHPEEWVHTVARYDWNFGDGQTAPNAGPAVVHKYAAGGVYHPTVTVWDNSGESGQASVTVTVPETMAVLQPNGGEVIASGSTYVIRWSAPAAAVKFNLSYSLDNGVTYIAIATGVIGTSYNWAVPKPTANKTQCLVKVVGINSLKKTVGTDVSNQTFTIEVIRVISPNGGDAWRSGTTEPITWISNATSKALTAVTLSYSTNGGSTWTKIADLKTNPKTYAWSIPAGINSAACRVKVELFNRTATQGLDTSDLNFSITP